MAFPLIIILILGLCYSFTIAPDITWEYFSADGGDLIAAAATGGVPHPSGYPLYLVLARMFQFVPVGTLAFRTNLFSAVCTILTALVLYAFLSRQLSEKPRSKFIALFAALAYGLAPFVWEQALVTEVYALHGLLIISCLLVLSLRTPKAKEWARGLVFGIAATNHLTSVLIFPLILLDYRQGLFVSLRTFLTRCVGLVVGLSLYLLLPLRASLNPPVNWGDTSTVRGFVWLVSGQLYRDYLFSVSFNEVLQRSRAFAGLLIEQYTWIGILLAIYGIFSIRSRRTLIATLWVGIVFLFFALFYGSKDSQVNLLPVWLVFSIWLAYGMQDLFELLHDRLQIQLLVGGLFFALLIVRIPFIFPTVDASNDVAARNFIDQSLAKIPEESLVFVKGDEQIFSLWYAQFALHRRLDLVIVAEDLLPYKWYVKSLHRNYPDVKIRQDELLQASILIAANPERVVCYISAGGPLQCPSSHSSFRNISTNRHDIDPVYLHSKPLSLPNCRSLFQEGID